MTSVYDDTRLGKKEGKRFYAKQHGGPHSAIYIYDSLRDIHKPKRYYAKHEDVGAGFDLLDHLNRMRDTLRDTLRDSQQLRQGEFELCRQKDQMQKQDQVIDRKSKALRDAHDEINSLMYDRNMLQAENVKVINERDGYRKHYDQVQQELTQFREAYTNILAHSTQVPDVIIKYEDDAKELRGLRKQVKLLERNLEQMEAQCEYHVQIAQNNTEYGKRKIKVLEDKLQRSRRSLHKIIREDLSK